MWDFFPEYACLTSPENYKDNPIDYLSTSPHLEYDKLNLYTVVKYIPTVRSFTIFICSDISFELGQEQDFIFILDNVLYQEIKKNNVPVKGLEEALNSIEKDMQTKFQDFAMKYKDNK
jgi:hypothetical protein